MKKIIEIDVDEDFINVKGVITYSGNSPDFYTSSLPTSKIRIIDSAPLDDDTIKLTIRQFVDVDGGEVGFCPELVDLVRLCRAIEKQCAPAVEPSQSNETDWRYNEYVTR